MRGARETLELALYDIRLPGDAGDLVAGELRAAAARGVRVRLLYNVDSNRPPAIQPPPSTRPELLHELPIEDRGVPGIPDLMHHKYVVRDRESVWTGSANWTTDSWTRQENVVLALDSEQLAAAYVTNFEELWDRRDVERSGRGDPDPIELGGRALGARLVHAGARRAAVAADRDGDRLRAPAGADRLAGDHIGPDTRDPG